MREVNKDLKLHFGKLQQRLDELQTRDKDHGYFQAEQLSKRNRRYDSSEEEEEAERKQSRERPSNAVGKNDHHQRIESFVHASHGGDMGAARSRGSDKENKRGANLINHEDAGGMQCIQESQMEDRSFRKRQNMLSDIQAMIVDYKKKSHYSNLVTNHDTGGTVA